ncbi:MAG: DUF2384 domain-containing protein [Cytophagales bacterium]|nr:DUF2384 domain-containing protein [Cytophagales bacterium]
MYKNSKLYPDQDAELSTVQEAAAVYNSPFDRIRISRKGLSPVFVQDLMQSYRLNKQEVARLADVSAKTLERHFDSGRPFQGLQSDRLLELADLYLEGLGIFGSQDKFLTWLETPTIALGHVAPKDWLDTHEGIVMISDEIKRIQHGIFA